MQYYSTWVSKHSNWDVFNKFRWTVYGQMVMAIHQKPSNAQRLTGVFKWQESILDVAAYCVNLMLCKGE